MPVTVAALTLRVRMTVAVSLLCLGLAVYVMIVQGRTDGPTLTVLCFSVLGGAGLIALAYLFKRVDQLYQTERATTQRLESLGEQLRTLQEVAVLDRDLPPADLLGERHRAGRASCWAATAAACTGSSATAGSSWRRRVRPASHPRSRRRRSRAPSSAGAAVRSRSATGRRRTAAATCSPCRCSCATTPTACSRSVYRRPRAFSHVDVRLAASFGGQVALALENARLRAEVAQAAVASERSRLARDLHDSVTQSLFAATSRPRPCAGAGSRRRRRRASNVEEVERLTRGALAEMRSLLLEMRPQALEAASAAARCWSSSWPRPRAAC